MRNWQVSAASFVLLATVLAVGITARAEPRDELVRKLDQEAIESDYLATNFAEAGRKLRQAVAICGRTGCSPSLLAEVHRDLGIVYVAWKKVDEAKLQFGQAFRFDNEVSIPKALTTPDVKAAFSAGVVDAQKDAKSSDDAPPIPRPEPPRKAPAKSKAGTEHTERKKKDEGSACFTSSDCASNSCRNGWCASSTSDDARTYCETDSQCTDGRVCKAGNCQANVKRNWIGIVAQADIVVLPAARDVCLNGTVYSCLQGDGTYYEPGQTVTVPGVKDEVKAGPALGTTRILLSYDRLLGQNFMLGGRLGYAFGGGPPSRSGASLLPVHVEARASVWFGSEPFARTGLRTYLVASVGVAQVDASAAVDVVENMQTGTLSAWKRSGSFFAGGGLGLFYALHRNTGFYFEVRGQRMFPDAGTVIPLQLGYAVGF
jgi:hypothetical protein